jgi:hypothetical protein
VPRNVAPNLAIYRRVLRQTSGALRQTEGSSRPRSARTRRKSLRREALEPVGRQPAQGAREILRPDRHLCGMRDDALRERRTGRRKIPNGGNGLSRVSRNRPCRTLTAPKSLAAGMRQSGLRKFSLRQNGDGGVAARGSVKSAAAVDWPQICHTAERFECAWRLRNEPAQVKARAQMRSWWIEFLGKSFNCWPSIFLASA